MGTGQANAVGPHGAHAVLVPEQRLPAGSARERHGAPRPTVGWFLALSLPWLSWLFLLLAGLLPWSLLHQPRMARAYGGLAALSVVGMGALLVASPSLLVGVGLSAWLSVVIAGLSFFVFGLKAAELRGRGWVLPSALALLLSLASAAVGAMTWMPEWLPEWALHSPQYSPYMPVSLGFLGSLAAGLLHSAAVMAALFPTRAEVALRKAVEQNSALELLEDRVPVRVRLRVPCKVPYGLRVTSLEEGVPLGNPILDHLLGLATVSPADSARLLSANEDSVLGLLHRFPESHLEPDAVVFEATADRLLSEAGQGSVQEVVDQGCQAAERLARLLAEEEP